MLQHFQNSIRAHTCISKSAVLIKVLRQWIRFLECAQESGWRGIGYRTLAENYFSVHSGEQNSLRVFGA